MPDSPANHDADYTELKPVGLRELGKNEYWLQAVIADNPKILGLGDDVELVDKERRQPSGGRLDLLLKNDNSNERFELEVQLGATDETHIVRTIEYWDIERRRYPGVDHVAVIAAEEISGRFFNVVGLFGNHIPLVALKVTAFQSTEGKTPLHFYKILDTRDLVSSVLDEEQNEEANEAYWVGRSTKAMIDLSHKVIAEISSGKPRYTKYYISTTVSGEPAAAKLILHPRKNYIWVRVALPEKDDITEKLLETSIFDCYKRGSYWFRLSQDDEFQQNKKILADLYRKATQPLANDETSNSTEL